MAFAQMRTLLSSMRWHHVGFAFFWALYTLATADAFGIGGAQAGALPLGGLVPIASPDAAFPMDPSAGDDSIAGRLTLALSLVIFAILMRRRPIYQPRTAVIPGLGMVAGLCLRSLPLLVPGVPAQLSAIASGVAVGVSSAAFMLMWQGFYASEGAHRSMLFIPVSAALSVAIALLVRALPGPFAVASVMLVLPALASLSLHRALRDVVEYPIEPLSGSRARSLLRDLGLPVFCVAALGLVWRLVMHLGPSGGAGEFLSMGGMVTAALIVGALEAFGNRGVDVTRLYQAVFPLVTGVFLLPTLLGQQWLPLLSGMTLFGFEIVNLMLIISCAAYAARSALHPSAVYAACVAPTILAIALGDALGSGISRAMLLDATRVVDVLFVCIYGLSLIMLLVSYAGRRKPASDESSADPAPEEEPLEERLGRLSLVDQLTAREVEVVELALKGNSVAAVARKLFISENTARSHFKSIYRKLGIHSKQELIDLLS